MLKIETADIEEVAAAMGRSVSWLKRNARKLHDDEGFPRPLPGSKWRFPRRAVELRFIAGGIIRRADNGNQPGVSLVELQQTALMQRYGVRV